MEILFVFLKWVASFAHMDAETGSKMDLGNLATVICPSILYARGRDAMRDETFSGLRVITTLLENQDEIFTVPEEFLPILHDQEYFANSLDLPSKEFLKKCDTYMRLKSNGRSIPGTPYQNQGSNGGGQQQPRYPINSPTMERPLQGPLFNGSAPSNSDRTGRPQQQQNNEYYPPPSSPPLPQGIPPPGMLQNVQRNQQAEQWTPTPPSRPNDVSGSPKSRPSSFVGPPPRPPPPSESLHSYSPAPAINGNTGYPSATPGRQRI